MNVNTLRSAPMPLITTSVVHTTVLGCLLVGSWSVPEALSTLTSVNDQHPDPSNSDLGSDRGRDGRPQDVGEQPSRGSSVGDHACYESTCVVTSSAA